MVEGTPKILNLLEPRKSASESISEIDSNIANMKETVSKLQETATLLNAEFESLNALQILGNIEQEIKTFTTKYSAILDALASNTQKEQELIVKINKAVDLLLR